MQMTLTLDPDVAQLVRDTIERERVSLEEAINEGLRKGLKPTEPQRSLRVIPYTSTLQPGFDPRGFNQLADESETESVIATMKSR